MLSAGRWNKAGEGLPGDRLFAWQGASGRSHVARVFDVTAFDCHDAGVWMLVHRARDEHRTPLLIGAASDVCSHLYGLHGDVLLRAIQSGASEVHVDLDARDAVEREAVLHDLATRWGIPAALNEATLLA